MTSIVAITIPICIAAYNFKTAGRNIRLFLLFLLAGLITDVTMFYMVQVKDYRYLLPMFNTYSLVEAMFFYWFILTNVKESVVRTILKILLTATPVVWFLFVILFPALIFKEGRSSQVFDTIYEISAAFLAGYALLRQVEVHGSNLSLPDFWILLGIFFYCFCTFFIMSFLNTILSQEIWYLNNIINILTYVFYSIGAWKSRQVIL